MMLVSKKCLSTLLFFISCSIHVLAQTDYYYYKGEKIPLTLNESKVCVSIPKDFDKTSERFLANVQVLSKIKDDDLDIFIISRSDLEKLTSQDFWEEDARSVIITSSYFTEDNKEIYATPYLNVRLNKEQDTDLLTSYVEKYKLRITWYSSLMPLWYGLAITQESNINTLECANELYESGFFSSSVPDFVSLQTELATVQNITAAKTETSPKIYDLYGRRLNDKATKGIYILNGKKFVVK